MREIDEVSDSGIVLEDGLMVEFEELAHWIRTLGNMMAKDRLLLHQFTHSNTSVAEMADKFMTVATAIGNVAYALPTQSTSVDDNAAKVE